MVDPSGVTAIVHQVRVTLRVEGVRPALELLNRASAHRFTALFRFEGETLRNLHLIDRDDPSVQRCPDMPVLESYCVYVRDTAGRFLVERSLEDARVEGHPKQRSVQSYCGLPLFDGRGELFGTICHFDFEPIPFTEDEVIVLDEIAAELVAAVEAGDWSPSSAAVRG